MQSPYVFEKEFKDPRAAWAFLNYLSGRYEPPKDCEIVCRGSKLSVRLKKEDAALSRLVAGYFEEAKAPAGSVELFCDGGSRGNPGPGAAAYVLLDTAGKVLEQGGRFFETCTNNQAEYWSLKLGLEAALAGGLEKLSIHMDSQLIVRQVKGEYKVRNKELLPLHRDVKGSLAELRAYSIVFVPRRHNRLADRLANQIMDENL